MNKRTYKLPNNKLTTDVDIYVESWKSLAKRITDITGWKVLSFCPDVQFLKSNGRTTILTVDEIEALTSYRYSSKKINIGKIEFTPSPYVSSKSFTLARLEHALYTKLWDLTDLWEEEGGSCELKFTFEGTACVAYIQCEYRPENDISFLPVIHTISKS